MFRPIFYLFIILQLTGLIFSKTPNFIVIFTDDQGYEDIGCFGSPKIKTPHLDKLAAEGRKFTSFYSANSVCSPSRAALMTGCYPTRVSVPGVLFPRHKEGLNPDEITIAEVLKTKGYATSCIGKWHIGHKPKFLPTRQGFDSYYGIPYSNDMTIDPEAKLAADINLREGFTLDRIKNEKPKKNLVPLMRNEEVIEYPCDQTTLTKRYTEEAVKFIEKNEDKPFFLYLPHTMPHIPLFASKKFKGKSDRGPYGDTIEEIDWSVGEIMKALRKNNLDENTLVIYTSDNGPWKLKEGRGGSAHPLRGYKFQTYEGGMRVPCIMSWKGKIPSGTVCDEIGATIDLLPTFANLAGAKIPDDRIIDGKNIWPIISGEKGARSPHEIYYYYKGSRLESARQGKWKVRRSGKKSQSVELYDLDNDIAESKNLSQKNPELIETILKKMDKFDKDLKLSQRSIGKQ
ncbi:MAG: arylsulfatase [Verrucomicrobia bacterium]|nr:MAG: arylsulfatase [Verrucomicrobiota bacterium]